MQPDFLLEALKACKDKGFHTAVDTSGHFAYAKLMKIIPFTDLFLFDLKHLDPEQHSHFTGVSNRVILENLRKIAKSGNNIMLRIPVIPGINDDDEHLIDMKRFILSIKGENILAINLLPYHKAGTAKYRKFNRENKMEAVVPPTDQRMKQLREYFSETGIKVKIGG